MIEKDGFITCDFVTVEGEMSKGKHLLANISIALPICKNAEQQARLVQQVKEWVASDEFWTDAGERLRTTANECRRIGKVMMFIPGEEYDTVCH